MIADIYNTPDEKQTILDRALIILWGHLGYKEYANLSAIELGELRAQLAAANGQLVRLNDYMAEHHPDQYWEEGSDTADSVLKALAAANARAEKWRGTAEEQEASFGELRRQLAEAQAELARQTELATRLQVECGKQKTDAEQVREQLARVRAALQYVANIGGNLPDDALISKTGANDAAYRGSMLVGCRAVAREALAAPQSQPVKE